MQSGTKRPGLRFTTRAKPEGAMEQREHKILLPQPNTPKAVQQGGLWRIWTVDTGENLSGPIKEGKARRRRAKKHQILIPQTTKTSRPHRAAFLLEGVADFDLTGAPEGGHSPTQRGRKTPNPAPANNKKSRPHRAAFLLHPTRTRTLQNATKRPGSRQAPRPKAQRESKIPIPQTNKARREIGRAFFWIRQNKSTRAVTRPDAAD
ncbi:hypothetical protein LA5094_00001 [Roseibium album]|nr:hypothetical protein LA5094_00001 [Roseibium album]